MKSLILSLFIFLSIFNAQAQCNADFNYIQNGPTTVFTDLSTVNSSWSTNYSVSWSWDFGDGSTSFVQSPSHTYDIGGSYEVSLKVINIYGQESEAHIENIILETGLMGDVNGDEIINILDIVIVANFVLGADSPSSDEYISADLNSDGLLNILDIVTLANLILGT